MNYTTEDNFMIAEGAFGKIYIFLQAKSSQPDSPSIIYDGNDHAVFLRTPEERIILDYIHPEARAALRKSREVFVVETIMDNIKDTYPVSMQIVEKIPVDWNKIGLKTWEEAFLEAVPQAK